MRHHRRAVSRRSGLSRLCAALAPLALAALALGDGAACSREGAGAAGDDGGAPPLDAAVEHVRVPYDGLAPPAGGPRTPVHAETLSTRVDTMQLMFAAGEMQTSGEPFTQSFAGRQLGYYDRYYLPVDQYLVPVKHGPPFFEAFTDLFGFSSAVESYEYSKYHMNMVANQSGAGVSLANGPLIARLAGATPRDRLRGRIGQLIYAAGTDVGGFAHMPPTGNALNDFGFPGLWPDLDPYRSFDPTMAPDTTVSHSCTTVTGYGGVQQFGNNPVPTYECQYGTLQLADRVAQTEHVIGPGVLGYATWKEAIWAIDFTGRLHDSQANPVTAVAPGDMGLVGKQGNQVQAVAPPPPPNTPPGVFIGSTPLEGMWGLTMVDEIDNAGAWLLSSLATADGTTLSGFASLAQAVQYDYGSPLVWFPTALAVSEDGNAPYPGVASLSIQDATSRAADLAALAQGYSLFFGMTDARNAAVGQQIGMQIAFDGTTFASDDGLPDGEDTPHDRALAVMRVAFVDLDRIHVDPTTGIVADTATVGGSGVTRGTTLTTTTLGHVVVGLRHLLMACNAAVSQYGAPDGDASKDALGILNSVAIHPPGSPDAGAPPLFSARVRQVLLDQAAFVRDVLTRSDGSVANGATLSGAQWTAGTDPTAVESQGAALRVLVEAWFLTHDTTFRDRGRAVATRLLVDFWSAPARMFRGQAGGADDVVMTPERFAWVQQALRETYEALWVPGDAVLDRGVLEDRIARLNKLTLNGWDDLNGDQLVDKATECLAGRLQMGEQALTGELGTSSNSYQGSSGPDRDVDCVQNIAYAKVASVLAGQVHFHAP
ncbi:MAG TPA: hypothetical protein VIF15_13050 [Polyangiaceae bacterium]